MNKILYGLVFTVVLPYILWLWANNVPLFRELHVPLWLSLACAISAALFCLWSMLTLTLVGKGLPMNAFPPANFVRNGPYFFFAHPIYVGFCIMLYAVFAYLGSSAGFYLVAPVVALGTIALAMGYENFDMSKRFPALRYELFIGLLDHTIKKPNLKCKVRFALSIYLIMLFFFAAGLPTKNGQMALLAFALLVPLSAIFLNSFKQIRAFGLVLTVLASSLAFNATLKIFLLTGSLALVALALFASSQKWLERMANSWTSWQAGPLRIINHGFYAALAALVGLLLWDVLLAGKNISAILFIAISGLFISGLWGQLLEGSGRLKRPFGYFGALLGGALAFIFLKFAGQPYLWEMGGALGVAFAFAQGFGRFRCLVNGCCHGASAPAWVGIRVSNPHSRVSKIPCLNNEPIYPSQFYSAIFLFLTGFLLLLLWQERASLSLIIGLYLILSGIGRFLEEATRGETQTKIIFRLRLYQWLALVLVALGMIFTCFEAPLSPAIGSFAIVLRHSPLYLSIALLFMFAFGVDFPQSQRRFSEL